MDGEANKALARRWVEALNAGRADLGAELLAPDYRGNGVPLGPEGLRRRAASILAAFPDLCAGIEALVAEGDAVAAHIVYMGTHSGALEHPALGCVAPTGRDFVVASVELFRIEGGRIAERWMGLERLGLLYQLGLLPDRGAGAP